LRKRRVACKRTTEGNELEVGLLIDCGTLHAIATRTGIICLCIKTPFVVVFVSFVFFLFL